MKNNTKKTSIIITVYNLDKYISHCLNSVLDQNYENLEIIVVNDGSTDDSEKIIKQYMRNEKRIILKNIVNSGVSKARATGLQCSTGDYIIFLDGDDEIEKNCLNLLINSLDENNVDHSIFGIKRIISNHKSYNFPLPQSGLYTNIEILNLMLKFKMFGGIGAKIYKREYLNAKDILINNDKIVVGEDFIMNVHYLSKIERVFISNEVVYLYNHRADSATEKARSFIYENFFLHHLKMILYKNNLFFDDIIKSYNYNYCIRLLYTSYFYTKNKMYFNVDEIIFNIDKKLKNIDSIPIKYKIWYLILKLLKIKKW